MFQNQHLLLFVLKLNKYYIFIPSKLSVAIAKHDFKFKFKINGIAVKGLTMILY